MSFSSTFSNQNLLKPKNHKTYSVKLIFISKKEEKKHRLDYSE